MRVMTMLWLFAASISSGAALNLPAATRRSVVANLFGGAATLVLPRQHAQAAFQDEEEMARRKAERLAIQTGSGRAPEEKGVSFSSGVQGLIERTIRTEELASGKPLSEERKAQIAAKVRALAPAEGVRGHLNALSCISHTLPPMTELAFFSVDRKAPARRRRASLTDRRGGHAHTCRWRARPCSGQGL